MKCGFINPLDPWEKCPYKARVTLHAWKWGKAITYNVCLEHAMQARRQLAAPDDRLIG